MKTSLTPLIYPITLLLILFSTGCQKDQSESPALSEDALERISVEGEHFVRNGKRIWLNGANTPWHQWEEFGGNDKGERMDESWWDAHFAKLAEHGITNTRVWLSCDGYAGIQITEEGYIEGPTDAFWEDVDKLMEIARTHRVYIMAGLMSFDHTKEGNPYYREWRRLFEDQDKMDSFVENYTVPLVKRYADNPYLFSIDVCNEILWLSDTERPETGSIPWENLQYFVAKNAQRVHEESEVLVCVSNYLKYTSELYEGHYWSDEALASVLDHPLAYVDFYKIHYYAWVHPHFGLHIEHTPEALGMGGKPAITGEISGKGVYKEIYNEDGSKERLKIMPLAEAYQLSLQNGWQGIQPWTSNGVDIHGDLDDIGPAARTFAEKYPDLVNP